MKYTLIDENGQYALILRGESMTQYAVVSGLDKKTGSWDWTCCYYDFGTFSELTKAEALFRALDYYLMRTNEKHISWARMSEIATKMARKKPTVTWLMLPNCRTPKLNTLGWIWSSTEKPQVKMPIPPQLHPARAAITARPIRGMHPE